MPKLNCLFFLLTFGSVGICQAQFYLDAYAGVNNSRVDIRNYPDELNNAEGRTDLFLGLAPGFPLSDRWSVLLNTQFSRRGYAIREVDDTRSQLRSSYLDFMPEIEYRPVNFLAIGLGVYYGAQVLEEFKNDDDDWGSTSELSFEVLTAGDFGMVGKLRFNYRNYFAFVRYLYGFQNISNLTFTNFDGEEVREVKLLNRSLQVGLGYVFDFGEAN
ncbi:MAG: outer membrane beta-barrel protein [Bacteroidota bacterium]